MKAEDLIVSAEVVKTGERLIGYVCGCKGCQTAFEDEEYDHSRPIGLLTHPEQLYGNVRVYTDNMEFVNFAKAKNKCYARNCDHCNIDNTCMYGETSKMSCQVNCWNCQHKCKKSEGDMACKNFSNLKER